MCCSSSYRMPLIYTYMRMPPWCQAYAESMESRSSISGTFSWHDLKQMHKNLQVQYICIYIRFIEFNICIYQVICQCERLRSQHVQSSLPWSCCCSSLTSLATWNDGNSHGIGREMCSWSHEMRVQHDNTWQDLDQVHHGLKGKYSGKPNED